MRDAGRFVHQHQRPTYSRERSLVAKEGMADMSSMQDTGIEHPHGLMDQVRDATFRGLDHQKSRMASELTSLVETLRQGGRQGEGGDPRMASFVDNAARQVERFAGGLRDRDVRQMVADTERFARERPSIFLGGAFVLGLAAARFLKSSATPEHPSMTTSGRMPATSGRMPMPPPAGRSMSTPSSERMSTTPSSSYEPPRDPIR